MTLMPLGLQLHHGGNQYLVLKFDQFSAANLGTVNPGFKNATFFETTIEFDYEHIYIATFPY